MTLLPLLDYVGQIVYLQLTTCADSTQQQQL